MDYNEPVIPRPLWLPTKALQAIIEESSGESAKNHFRRLKQMWGWMMDEDFTEILEYMHNQAVSLDLEDIQIERFPADGEKFYGAFLTEPAWNTKKGILWQVTPRSRRLADFSITVNSLSRYSRSTETEAELIYVGDGTSPEDYEGKDVAGKIVLASGAMTEVHEEAVHRHGALGAVTFRTRNRIDQPDFISGGSLGRWKGPDGSPGTFGFGLSYRQGQSLIADLERGPVRVRVEIDAKVEAGEYRELTGVIPGSELPSEEILVTAHMNHRGSGGNNSTGTGVSLEVARILTNLISSGILPKPRRTIRFIWGAEHYGLNIYLNHHPELLDKWLYVIDYDMAGKNQKEGVRYHLTRSPYSNPTVTDDVVQEVLEWVVEGNRELLHNRDLLLKKPITARLESSYLWPIIDPRGSRDDFLAGVRSFWGPSDHEELNANTFKVHSVMISDSPDQYIGVYQDSPETADATQMKRTAVIGAVSVWALANAGPREAEQLAANGVTRAGERLKTELRKAIAAISNCTKDELPRKSLDARIALEWVIDTEKRGFKEIEPWLEGDEKARSYIDYLLGRLASDGDRILEEYDSYHQCQASSLGVSKMLAERSQEEEKLRGKVPIRAKTPLGPVNLNRYRYGQAWLAKQVGNWEFLKLAIRDDGYFVHYELLNFVDGKRDLLQIRDAVSAEFGSIPAEHVAEYFELMEQARVVHYNSNST